MKRNISIFLAVILLVVCVPMTAYAQTYDLSDTDMSISVDDSIWYVFTRDNIQDNPELEELGVPYDEIYGILYDNGVYVNAVLYYENGGFMEFFVRKKALDTGMAQLSNYKDDEVMELAEELGKKHNTDQYSVYKNRYKYARLEYMDSDYGYYICEFVTCVNRENYTFTFQSDSPYTEEEYEEMERIVDSVQFDVDPTLKEKKTNSFFSSVAGKTLGGAVAGGVAGAVIGVLRQKKKKGKKTDAGSIADNIKTEE